jgi:hypothetical protein
MTKNRPSGLSLEEAFRWFMPGEPPPALSPAEGCWEWPAYCDRRGYGTMEFGGKLLKAHAVAYRIFIGENESELVRHTCDNPPCVQPAHLLAGTVLDNVRDRVERERSARGARQHLAKLTDDSVREIRRLAEQGVRQVDLARLFGVGQSSISAVVRGETWSHIGGAHAPSA